MKISIVINTLNRAHLLGNTLSSFKHLDYDNFEVIVVNGPSTDGTNELLQGWASEIKIGHCPEANLSMSRNIGIAMASGELVAFIDDDAIPEPEWLNQILDGFDSYDVAAAGGKVFDHTGYQYQYQYANANRLGHGKWNMTAPSMQYCFPYSYEFPYLQGTNTVFRRSALLEIGGFDEEFAYYLDETEVCLRLIDKGYIVRQLHNAYVHHKYAPSHIRSATTAIYRYPVLKSKVYFSNRHGRLFHSLQEIFDDNAAFMQNHRSDVIQSVKSGRLTESDLLKFEAHVSEALKEGFDASWKHQKLLTDQLLHTHQSEFKSFKTLRALDRQLTIALLCEDYPPNLLGGIARFTQDKATALARLGHKVHVIARSTGQNTVDFENGVWVHRINAAHHPLSEDAARLKLPQSHWDQSKSYLDELDRISTHRKIDIVETPVWNIVGISVALSKKYKLVTSLQTTLKLSLPSRPDLTKNATTMSQFVEPIVAGEQLLIQRSDAVLAISQGIADEVEQAYGIQIDKERLHVSHLGMPDWSTQTSELKSTDKSGVDVLFVGRLERRKGIDLLLDAIPRLLEKHPKARFHIVGDDSIPTANGGTYREMFERSHPDLQQQVIFYGKVDEQDLRSHYAKCDLFVAPSRFESFGLIYVEAMMFGKPVIGCRIGGIPEIIKDGTNGILVPTENVDDLYSAIDKLIENPALRVELGSTGRKMYLEKFTDEAMAIGSEAIYKDVLDQESQLGDDEQ